MNEARYSRLTREFPERAGRAVRAQRAGRDGSLSAPAEAEGHVRRRISLSLGITRFI